METLRTFGTISMTRPMAQAGRIGLGCGQSAASADWHVQLAVQRRLASAAGCAAQLRRPRPVAAFAEQVAIIVVYSEEPTMAHLALVREEGPRPRDDGAVPQHATLLDAVARQEPSYKDSDIYIYIYMLKHRLLVQEGDDIWHLTFDI